MNIVASIPTIHNAEIVILERRHDVTPYLVTVRKDDVLACDIDETKVVSCVDVGTAAKVAKDGAYRALKMRFAG